MHIIADGQPIAAEPGDTILSALRRAERNVMHVCGGRGMCGTCRVAIDPDHFARLTPPVFAEIRLLRVLKAARPHHRLACQTVLATEHDQLAFTSDSPTIIKISAKQENDT